MILAKGKKIEMHGNVMELLAEFTGIIESMREMLNEDFSASLTDNLISTAGKLAFMSEVERKELREEIDKW